MSIHTMDLECVIHLIVPCDQNFQWKEMISEILLIQFKWLSTTVIPIKKKGYALVYFSIALQF